MRRKSKPFSKSRDETEDVVQIIHSLELDKVIPTKSAVITKLMKLKKINEETAKANIDCALCLGVIVMLHEEKFAEPVLRDILRLKYVDANNFVDI